jgi:predicted SnoaL-like aldol condensation-catalyzing enzyme
MGEALDSLPRSSRVVNAVLTLLEQHGQRNRSELFVSRPTPQQWCLHCSEFAEPGAGLCRSLLGRWPALQAFLADDDEPISAADIMQMDICGDMGGTRKDWGESSYLFSIALGHEFELRCQRERELRQVRLESIAEVQALRDERDALRQQLEQANAENAQRAAYVADSDSRLERLQQQAANAVEQVAALAAELAALDRNKDLVRTCIHAMNRRDWAAIQMLLAPDFIQHDPVSVIGHVPGADELAPDPQHIDSLIAEGDLVAAHLRAGGAGPGLAVTHIRIYRIVADQIAEVWGA